MLLDEGKKLEAILTKLPPDVQYENHVFTLREEKRANRYMAVDGTLNTVMLRTFRWIRQHLPKGWRAKLENKLKKY